MNTIYLGFQFKFELFKNVILNNIPSGTKLSISRFSVKHFARHREIKIELTAVVFKAVYNSIPECFGSRSYY